jgi:hypothetical protein
MTYFRDRMRALTCAARLRDWETIDAVLEDYRVCGNASVLAGFADARKILGQEPPLPALDAPEPVTIHDLPNLDGIEIVGTGEGDTRRWQRKKAA